MRIAFNISYRATVLLKGGKRPKPFWLFDPAEIDVPEVSLAEAPLAARWQAVTGHGTDFTEHTVHSFEGELYEPVKRHYGESKTPLSVDEAVRIYGSGTLQKPERMPAANAIRHRLGDNRDEERAGTMKLLAGLLSIDGVPHIKCGIPKIYVTKDERRMFIGVTSRPGYIGERPILGIDKTSLYRLNEGAGAERAARLTQRELWRRAHTVEVFEPSAFHFDREAEMVGRTVGQAVVDNAEKFHKWPRPVIEAFLDLKAGYQRWLETPSSADVADLLDDAYALFTSGDYYHDMTMDGFFSNYEKAQAIIPEMSISLSGVAG